MATGVLTPSQRRTSLAAVLTSAVASGMTIGMATPLVALTMAAAGHGGFVVGLNAAAQALTVLAIGPFVPGVVKRIGPVPALLGGLLLAAGALAAFPLLPSLAAWFALRMILGLGGAFDWIVSETWINSLAAGPRRGRIVALYATLWGGGVAAGPLLLTVTGIDGVRPFLVGAGLLVAACLPVLAARRLAPPMAERASPAGIMAVLPAAPLAVGAAILAGFGEGTVFALLPVYGVGVGFAPAAAVLLMSVFAAGSILLQLPLGWLADHLDRRWLLVAITATSLLCLGAVPLVLDYPGLLWPVMFVWGGAAAGYYTVGLVLLIERFDAADLASANTTFIMAYTAGMVVGPALGGGVMELWQPHGLLPALALPALLFLWVIFRGRPWRRARPAEG